jgi:hypothetical protein
LNNNFLIESKEEINNKIEMSGGVYGGGMG